MGFGFEHGDGWLDIIDRAGAQLEPMIESYLKEHPDGECECGHTPMFHGTDACSHIAEVPIRWGNSTWYSYTKPELWKNLTVRYKKNKYHAIRDWLRCLKNKYKTLLRQKLNGIFLRLYHKFHIHMKIHCNCAEYYPDHPKATQIKEKFGEMRFYMGKATKEMHEVARWAELESLKFCEICGLDNPTIRNDGWIRNLCDSCEDERVAEEQRRRDEWERKKAERASDTK
jgi:hypothetical protein